MCLRPQDTVQGVRTREEQAAAPSTDLKRLQHSSEVRFSELTTHECQSGLNRPKFMEGGWIGSNIAHTCVCRCSAPEGCMHSIFFATIPNSNIVQAFKGLLSKCLFFQISEAWMFVCGRLRRRPPTIDGHGGAQQRQLCQHSGCRDSELHSLHDILQVSTDPD